MTTKRVEKTKPSIFRSSKSEVPSVRESLVYVGLIGFWLVVTALFIGFRPEHLFLAVVLCAGWFLSGSSRRLMLALAPFAIFGISYDWMNLLPNYEVNSVDVGGIYSAEKWLFGLSTTSGTVTPNEWFAGHTTPFWDIMSGVFYLCWVPVPMIFGIWLYASGQRKTYLHFALVFLLVNLLGFMGYYIHPAAPPWYAAHYGAEAAAVPGTLGEVAGLGAFDQMTGWNIFHGLYARNANVFAAVPSLHSAYVLVAFIYSLRSRSPLWLKVLLFIISAGIWFAAVYTSHHYIIDVMLGILTAILGWLLFEKVLMRLPAFSRWMASYLRAITPNKSKND